jgi:YD repeat-containing protein
VINDTFNCYTYNAENQLTAVAKNCTTDVTGYVYDAEGRRVAKTGSTGSERSEFYYDVAGNLVTEADSGGNWTRAEIYAGNRHIATWASGQTYFNHADWLGTERARSSSAGAQCETIQSLPFGDNEVTSGACNPTPKFFTGKERDSESGNEYFGASLLSQ